MLQGYPFLVPLFSTRFEANHWQEDCRMRMCLNALAMAPKLRCHVTWARRVGAQPHTRTRRRPGWMLPVDFLIETGQLHSSYSYSLCFPSHELQPWIPVDVEMNVEASRQARADRQQSRYRDRGGYVSLVPSELYHHSPVAVFSYLPKPTLC